MKYFSVEDVMFLGRRPNQHFPEKDGRKRIKVEAIAMDSAALIGKWSAILNPPSLAPSVSKPIQIPQ